jgi:hypothetical protein
MLRFSRKLSPRVLMKISVSVASETRALTWTAGVSPALGLNRQCDLMHRTAGEAPAVQESALVFAATETLIFIARAGIVCG